MSCLNYHLEVGTCGGGYGLNYHDMQEMLDDVHEELYISPETEKKLKKWLKNKERFNEQFRHKNVKVIVS